MRKYIARRLLLMIPVLFGISVVIFILINLAPGDPYTSMIDPNISAEDKRVMLEEIGYYDPLPVKYLKWAVRAVQGDLGYSIRYKEPVTKVMSRNMANTMLLSISALFFSVLVGVPIGVLSATRKYSLLDNVITVFSFIGLSVPVFFFGMLMIKFLAFDLSLFPISGMTTIGRNFTGLRGFVDLIHHMVLPVTVLGMVNMASLMRYTRSSMLEVITQDYIRTARAKGLRERTVIYKHALKNALIPVVTVICMSIGYLLSGALLTETVFSWPGMGTLVYQSILNRDYPLVIACTMVLAIFILMSNLLADIIYAFLDPRIKFN
jgi:peptide/nickel transport system permease protein